MEPHRVTEYAVILVDLNLYCIDFESTPIWHTLYMEHNIQQYNYYHYYYHPGSASVCLELPC